MEFEEIKLSSFEPSAPPLTDSIEFELKENKNQRYFDTNSIDLKGSNIKVVPFKINELSTRDKFTEWIQSLWFTPTGFKKQSVVPSFKKCFIPFYIFDIEGRTSYEAEYVEISLNPKTQQNESHWEVSFGSKFFSYHHMVFCAEMDNSLKDLFNSQLKHSLMKEDQDGKFWYNKFSTEYFPLSTIDDMYDIRPAHPVNFIWNNFVDSNVVEEERNSVENSLKRISSEVRRIKVELKYDHVNQQIIYLPAFVGSYFYERSKNFFIVNGIEGNYDGQRPCYGLGKMGDLKKGVTNFVGTLMKWNTDDIRLIKGSDLITQDSTNVYNVDLNL